ncbi:MAG: LecA/PA-IL family lectin [Actinomycetota bacterium]|nr:MAG: hypothetical protein FD171_1693 [Actinomycetota bacterium]MDO8949906.1 LecA/PA-IL family lectin [Actinomycetota bacterium]MDP3631141.1 LecA/PA-IL family lectin [Actinomycetota bacterium]
MESRGRRVLLILLLILVLVSTWVIIRPFRTEIVIESRTEVIRFDTQKVASAELPVGTEAVVQAGTQGRKAVYAYFEEHSFLGKVTSREAIAPDGRPTERVELAPVVQILEYGTASKFAVELIASAESGVDIGVIGSGGTLLVKASGSIRYWKGGTCGPEGDSTHNYTFVPIRPSANVGALLFRVGDGPYTTYSELAVSGDMRAVSGTPGQHVRAVINDAPGLYADNAGTLRISVLTR